MDFRISRLFRRKKSLSRNERVEKYANNSKHRGVKFKGMLPRLLLGGVFVIIAVILLPPTQRIKEVQFKTGEIADKDVIAPFDFDVALSPEELEFKRAQAAVSIPPVYVKDNSIESELTRSLGSLFDTLSVIIAQDTLAKDAKLQTISNLIPYLPENSVQILLSRSTLKEIKREARKYQKKLFSDGLIDNSGPLRRGDYSSIVILDGDKEERVAVKNIIDQGRIDRVIKEASLSLFKKSRTRAQVFFEVVRAHTLPNLILNMEETQIRRSEAMEKVRKFFTISKNQRIIGNHDKITKEQENILRALEKARVSLQAGKSPLMTIGMYTAEVLRLLLFVLLFGAYLFAYHPNIYRDLLRLSSIFFVMIIFLAFTAVVVHLSLTSFLIPVAFVSLMLTSLFNLRLGLVATVLSCFLISLIASFQININFVALLAGIAGALALKSLRSRSHFYTVFLYVSIAYVVGIFSIELGQAEKFHSIYAQSFWGIANGLFSSIAAMFLMPIFENIFNLTTRFTLLELTDLNKPILKRLNMEAHGTYHHSMLLGNLVDTVAREIGADPLKARVMAYYHDIGKIFKPEYYTENQDPRFNKHEKITPKMSSLILLSHVKDGVELAREEKLPDIILDAIREHHGTTVMAFFYQKALETDSHSSVNKDDFRYPGPRPRSKESAILMLADSVEAAVRSLKAPTPAHIRNMVAKLIDTRAQENELDDSGLTLNDLARIKEKFITILTGIYHKRIAYPGQEEEEPKKSEAIVRPLG